MFRFAASVLVVTALLTCVLLARQSSPSPAPEKAGPPRTALFQEGRDGYAGTVDVEIWEVSPHTCLEGNPNASSDADNDGGESQILMRFDSIFGTGPGQVPPGACILSAK